MDDLTRIKGIGRKTADGLHLIGVRTFARLAEVDAEFAERHDIKAPWVAEAAGIVAAESKVSEGQSPADAAAAPDPAGLAKAGGDPSTTAEGLAGGDAPSAIDAAGTDTEGKPPRPDLGAEGSAEAAALPADSGAGDPQQNNPASEDRGGGSGDPAVPARERRRFPVNWALMHDGRLIEAGATVELTLVEHQRLSGGVVSADWPGGEIVA